MKALRVLNLEDSPLDTELLHMTLTEGGIACEVLRVQTRAGFVAALENGDFDIVLADYSLPSFDGLSALKVAQEIRPEVPFVLVSGMLGEEKAIEALKSGATDYVLKQRLQRLVPAVRRAVREAEERTARKRAEEALRYQLDLTRTITNNAVDSLFLWDTEGRVTFMNPAAEQTFGWRQEELLGEALHDKTHHRHPDGRPYPLSECLLVRASESGQTLRDHEDLFFRRDGSPIDVACSLAPIVVEGKTTGAALVVRDITERKRAEEEVRTRQRQQAAIAGLGIWALGGMGLSALMDEAVALVARTLDVEYCEVLELLPDGERLLLRAGVGWKERLVGRATVGTGLESQAGYTLVAGEPVVVEDLRAESRFSGPPLLREHGVVSGMTVVIHEREGPFGVLGAHAESRRTFTEDDVNFLQSVANVLATAVERKRGEEAQRFLAEAGAALSSSLDYRATLTGVARLTVPYLADWCAVDILEEEGSLDRLALTHQDPEKVALAQELQERYPDDPDAPYGVPQVLRTGRSELGSEIPEAALDEAARDAEHRRLLRGLGLKSYMIVPLVARGRTLGAITLVSAESGRRYGEADLELAEELARRAALAVDNARLYRGRSRVARALQEGLLPARLPEVPGVEVGLRYVPAGDVDVGGDFYDLFDTGRADQNDHPESHSWGVLIGDVSGKGAEAAAVLALARYTIRAVARRESRPSAVLAGLNEALLRQRRERNDHKFKFCTIAYASIEKQRDAEGVGITLSLGGHPAPVVLKADGSIRKIGRPGRAMGVFDDANLAEQESRLFGGDALVLYTDGVLEARAPDGTYFGEERLVSLLRSSVGLDAEALAGRIESAVMDFQEKVPRDDIAVLALRVSN